jgi:hypothetical protein
MNVQNGDVGSECASLTTFVDKMLPEQGVAEGLPATAPPYAPIGDSPMASPCCVSIGGSEILSFA